MQVVGWRDHVAQDVPVGLIWEIYNYSNLRLANWTGLAHDVEITDHREVAKTNSKWNSVSAAMGKFLLGAGLTIGGFLTHGPVFLLAGLSYDVTISAVDNGMLRQIHESLSNHILFVLALGGKQATHKSQQRKTMCMCEIGVTAAFGTHAIP